MSPALTWVARRPSPRGSASKPSERPWNRGCRASARSRPARLRTGRAIKPLGIEPRPWGDEHAIARATEPDRDARLAPTGACNPAVDHGVTPRTRLKVRAVREPARIAGRLQRHTPIE